MISIFMRYVTAYFLSELSRVRGQPSLQISAVTFKVRVHSPLSCQSCERVHVGALSQIGICRRLEASSPNPATPCVDAMVASPRRRSPHVGNPRLLPKHWMFNAILILCFVIGDVAYWRLRERMWVLYSTLERFGPLSRLVPGFVEFDHLTTDLKVLPPKYQRRR